MITYEDIQIAQKIAWIKSKVHNSSYNIIFEGHNIYINKYIDLIKKINKSKQKGKIYMINYLGMSNCTLVKRDDINEKIYVDKIDYGTLKNDGFMFGYKLI